jgi:hypothetical protein
MEVKKVVADHDIIATQQNSNWGNYESKEEPVRTM